jgi:hypothetical protein
MVLVAAVAVLLGASSAYRRSTYCRYAADDCAVAERQHRLFAAFHEQIAKQDRSMAEVDRERVRTAESESAREVSTKSAQFWDEQVITSESMMKGSLARAERAAALRAAFVRASRRPWLAIPILPNDLQMP